MGLLALIRDGLAYAAKALDRHHRAPPDTWVGATILPGESANPYSYSSRDMAAVQRGIVQTLNVAISLNALTCSQQPLRLYRPVSRTSKVWRGRRVTDRKALAWLRGDRCLTPGLKAVNYARYADDLEEVTDHPALTLLRNPDPFFVGSDFSYLRFWFKEAAGKAFAYRGERVGGQPSSLYHLMPQFTRVSVDSRLFIDGFYYGRNQAAMRKLPPEDVIYFRQFPDPMNPWNAVSWPESVQLYGDAENAALTAEIARWKNGGHPSMVFEGEPGLSLDVMKQARADFDANYRGVMKAGKPLWLARFKLAQYASKPHEMQYEKGLETAEGKIRKAAGIPEPVWNMAKSNLAGAYEADPQYMGQTINPRTMKDAEELTEWLLPDFGVEPGEMWFAYDDAVGEDEKAMEEASRADVAGGILTINEARALRGVDPVEPGLGDVLRINGIPLQTQEQIDAQRQAQADALAAQSRGPGSASRGGEDDDAGEGGKGKGAGPLRLDGRSSGGSPRGLPQLRTKGDDLGPLPPQLERLLRSFSADLQQPYGHAFANGVDDIGSVRLPDEDIEALAALFRRYVPRIMEAAGNDMLTDKGIDASFSVEGNPYAAQFAEEHGARLVTNISETMRDALRTRVADAVREGQSIAQLQASIKEAAPEFAATRCEAIARTETGFASNEGIRLAARENGLTRKRWLVAGGPCPVCEGIAAANPDAIGIDEPFAGTDVQAPPAHPNCRCILTVEEAE